MNWTGGRRARHNSNASFNTAGRLQKQYFARVRMEREARQATAALVRSSSPISLANAPESQHKEKRDHDGYGIEGAFQGKSRSIWGSKTSAVHQQAEGSKQQEKKDQQSVQKRTGIKSKILALELGENSNAVSKKPGAMKRKKKLLLQETDWLETKKKNTFTGEDESDVCGPTQSNEGAIDHEEESDIDKESNEVTPPEDEGSDAILLGDEGSNDTVFLRDAGVDGRLPMKNNSKWQNAVLRPPMGKNIPTGSIDGSESIFLEIGNVHFSKSRGKTLISALASKTLRTLPEDMGTQPSSSDSILLNFEDTVLPSVLGDPKRDLEPEERITLPPPEFLIKTPSNSESFLTWSSSDYSRKNGNANTPKSPMSDTTELGFKAQLESSPRFQQSSGSSGTTLPPMDFKDNHSGDAYNNFLQSPHDTESSLDVFAVSLESEAQSDGGQWLDMMLKEYYLDERRDESHCTSEYRGIDDQHDVREKDANIKCMAVTKEIYGAGENSGALSEDQLWQELGRESTERNKSYEKVVEDGMSRDFQVEGTMIKNSDLAKESTNPKVKATLEIDLQDDKAWRDFVYQPCIEESWEEELVAPDHLNSKRHHKRKYLFGGEPEDDDFISPIERKKRGVIGSSWMDMNSNMENSTENNHILADVESNAATIGTDPSSLVLDSENTTEPDSFTIGNDSFPLSSENITNGCSSIAANAPSSPLMSHFTTENSLEVESTISYQSIASSPPKYISAIKDKNFFLQTEQKKAMWGKDVRDGDSEEEGSLTPKRLPLSRRAQTDLGAIRSITGIKKMFEVGRGKGGNGSKELVDQIEEW